MLQLVFCLLAALSSGLKSRRTLVLENLALRHQLGVLTRSARRSRLQPCDRLLWIVLRRLWADWKRALVLVQPATVVRWHREGFRRFRRRRSARRPGRPGLDPAIRALIRRMAAANPLWGAPRIHGELVKLGITVSERAVSRCLPRTPRRPPSQTWRAFLANHLGQLVSVDFFTVPTVRNQVLFCFLVLAHDRRRVLHVNVTDHPTAAWTTQQLLEAFPSDTAPRYLLRDRDTISSVAFRQRVAGLGLTEVLTAPHAPWQSPSVERLIGSIRRECLDHVIVLNAAHLRRILARSLRDYHKTRTHVSLEKDAPERPPVDPPAHEPIVQVPEVGGLHHRSQRRAA